MNEEAYRRYRERRGEMGNGDLGRSSPGDPGRLDRILTGPVDSGGTDSSDSDVDSTLADEVQNLLANAWRKAQEEGEAVLDSREYSGDAPSGGGDSGGSGPRESTPGYPALDVARGVIAGAYLAASIPALELLSLASVGALRKPLLWSFWAASDVGKWIRYGPDVREFGIRAWCGLFGKGKTVSMVERAWRRKQKLGEKIEIYSNVPCSFADGPIRGVEHLKEMWHSEKNTIFMIDEIHLQWNQHGWKDQDPDLLTSLTQQRKAGPGFSIYYTTQHAATVEIIWRRLAEYIIDCNGWPTSRWIHQKAFAGIQEYNEGQPRFNPISGKDMRNIAWEYAFVASDAIRLMYDTKWVASKMGGERTSTTIGVEAVQRKIAEAAASELASMALRQEAERATWGAKLQGRLARIGRS